MHGYDFRNPTDFLFVLEAWKEVEQSGHPWPTKGCPVLVQKTIDMLMPGSALMITQPWLLDNSL